MQPRLLRNGRISPRWMWLVALVAAGFGPLLAARAQFGPPPGLVKVQVASPLPASAGSTLPLTLRLTVKPGYHINANPASESYLIATAVSMDPAPGISAQTPTYPSPLQRKFVFTTSPIKVYQGITAVQLPVVIAADAAPGPRQLHGQVRFQACNENSCLAPSTTPWDAQLTVKSAGAGSVPLSGAAASDDAAASNSGGAAGWLARLRAAPLWLQLLLVFLGGLGLNITPCVYPMIPITIGYFGAQSQGRAGRTFGLAFLYVLGLALVYSLLGVSAALTGTLFGSALQSPFAVGFVAVVLLLLGLSMLGLFTIQPPRFVLASSGGRQGAAGALAMGALLGIVAAPCVGPVVAGLLTYVGQRASVPLGFALFFALSLGLGAPYLVLGGFSGAVKSLPRSGAWMVRLKKIFAVPLLVAACYYGFLAWHGATLARPQAAVAEQLAHQFRVTGLPTIVFIDGAGRERTDLRAGEELTRGGLIAKLRALSAPGAGAGGAVNSTHWPAATAAALTAARSAGRPVVLDFRADWCLPCLKLERDVFSRPEVAAAAAGVQLLRVDLTTG